MGGGASSHRPQRESGGDTDEFDDCDPFQAEGVGEADREVGEDDGPERRRHEEGEAQGHDAEDGGSDERFPRGDLTRGDRALTFHRMEPIASRSTTSLTR